MSTVTTVSGGISNATTPSTLAGAILKNTSLVDSTKLNTGAIVTADVAGATYSLDTVSGGAVIAIDNTATVTLIGGAGNDQLLVGNDKAGSILQAGTGIGQTLVGGAGGQLLGTSAIGNGSATILGGTGADTVVAAAGNNVLTAGAGNNLIGIVGGNNQIYAAGNDTVIAGGGNATIGAGTGDTLINVVGGSNLVIGGSGNSTIAAAAGNNTLFGGSGNTTIAGGAGNNLLIGSTSKTGNAVLGGFAGDDSMIGGVGNDTLFGGTGNDIFVFSTVFGAGKHVIGDFTAGSDLIAVQGYGLTADQVAAKVTVSGGNSVISLSDGTQITIAGVTTLTAKNFAV